MSFSKVFVLLKPDCMDRGLTGAVISRFEKKGFRVFASKVLTLSKDQVLNMYGKYSDQDFYKDLEAFMMSGPSMALVLSHFQRKEGDTIQTARALAGAFNPIPGTIRGELAESQRRNIVHVSDSGEAVIHETVNVFGDLV